ncbi:MAG: hypothetical protein HKO57_16810, partial [Akkermansiaceae bacterium]|nr:hypothetical protein [Akkermansiaceae bacterium]
MSPRSEELANDRVPRCALAAAGLALAVLAAVVYAQTGAFAFLDYDDPLVVTGNEVVQKGLGGESLRFAFQDTRMNLYHPLTWLSHLADVSLFGDWAGGHHLVNAALHLANGLLVLLLAVRVGGRPAPSFVVAALFVVHPMHVESVAWISERKDVLSTFFYLLTVLLYVRWTASRSRTLYGAALLSCLLGFLSKPGLMTLPFALLLLDCWPLRRLDPGDLRTLPRRILPLALEKAPFFLLAAVFMAVAWRIQSTGAHAGVADMTSFPERLALTGLGYASWLLRTVWPAGLSAFYPHPATIASAAV